MEVETTELPWECAVLLRHPKSVMTGIRRAAEHMTRSCANKRGVANSYTKIALSKFTGLFLSDWATIAPLSKGRFPVARKTLSCAALCN